MTSMGGDTANEGRDKNGKRGRRDKGDDESEITNAPERSRRGFLQGTTVAGGVLALGGLGTGTVAAGGAEASDENGGDSDADNDADEEVSDIDLLNFALSLEHLEAAYYNDFLDEYSESEVERSDGARVFADPGSRFSTYQRVQTIRDHEEAHVEALTQTIEDLGGDPVEPAEYDFAYESVEEFVDLSATIEAVGVSAYAGAAPLIDDDDVLAAALSIHSVEARHTSYFNVLDTTSPFPNAFDPARTMDEVLDIASQFIVGMDREGDENGDSENGDDEESETEGGDDSEGSGELSLADLRAATGSGSNPREEYLTYENTGNGRLDLTGWTVSNDRGTTYSFPDGFTLAPGETVTLYTGQGTDTASELYWGESEEIWNDRLGTMVVRDASDDVALRRSYP